jgi:hypothetical protein
MPKERFDAEHYRTLRTDANLPAKEVERVVEQMHRELGTATKAGASSNHSSRRSSPRMNDRRAPETVAEAQPAKRRS